MNQVRLILVLEKVIRNHQKLSTTHTCTNYYYSVMMIAIKTKLNTKKALKGK